MSSPSTQPSSDGGISLRLCVQQAFQLLGMRECADELGHFDKSIMIRSCARPLSGRTVPARTFPLAAVSSRFLLARCRKSLVVLVWSSVSTMVQGFVSPGPAPKDPSVFFMGTHRLKPRRQEASSIPKSTNLFFVSAPFGTVPLTGTCCPQSVSAPPLGWYTCLSPFRFVVFGLGVHGAVRVLVVSGP